MKVVKFGGTSLASGSQVKKVIKIIAADKKRRVVIVSAPGKRFSEDTKITDLLLQLAENDIQKKDNTKLRQQLIQRYQDIADDFGLGPDITNELTEYLKKIETGKYPSEAFFRAALAAQGEHMSAWLITKLFQASGLKARNLTPEQIGLLVSSRPGQAQVLPRSYAKIAQTKLNEDEIVVFPGFYGVTKEGWINTFARGGSDITGSILARGFASELYENFTDVDTIYAVDPHLVKDPAAITKMSYREMRELSYAGFGVFNDEAILPAIEGQIPINVKNTNDPEKKGTMIVPASQIHRKSKITGIASSDKFSALFIHSYLVNRQVGFSLKVLQILADLNISYEHMPSGIDDITIIFAKDQLTNGRKEQLTQRVKDEIKPDTLEWKNDYSIIMVVGEGLVNRVGAIAGIVDPLKDKGISLTMVNQGSSEISIMLGVRPSEEKKAVEAIYDANFKDGKPIVKNQ